MTDRDESEESDPTLLIDDDILADMIRAIAGQSPEAADEFEMFILEVDDRLDGRAPAIVRNTLRRSMELAFPYTDTSRAAFVLYLRDKRGMVGSGKASDLIWELVR
ncbi:MAG TPA: hypothetical protein VJX67_04415, partial [Blastocatellia bacterium]|nr:hypothetical protein [Blastocatellia bacterium]